MGASSGLAWWALAVASAIAGAVSPTPWVQLAVIAGWCAVVWLRRRSLWSARVFGFSLVAAALFVLTRLAYLAAFGGLSPASAVVPEAVVLWSFEQVWLPGPFASIHIGGAVTLAQVLATAGDATRFAVVFVAFGAASALVDLRRGLAKAPRMLAPLALTISISISVFHSLALVTRSLNQARLLRGVRRRSSLLLPLLSEALERAQALGVSMTSRGWPNQRRQVPVTALDADELLAVPACSVRDVSVTVAGRVLFEGLSFELAAGSLALLEGATGSGKSTLLAHLRGVAETAVSQASGVMEVAGHPASLGAHVGLTTQRPERSFVAPTVREELAFSVPEAGDVEAFATQVGVTHLLGRRTDQLSAGESALVAIAAAAASKPRLLLLDEPIADLDRAAVERVLAMIAAVRADGTAVLVAEHRAGALRHVADVVLRIEHGAVRVEAARACRSGEDTHTSEPCTPLLRVLPPAAADTPSELAAALLNVQPGSITALVGANGSGKTTLLNALAFDNGESDRGNALRRRRQRPNKRIALVATDVDSYFFAPTLAEEIERNDRSQGLQPGTTEGLLRRLVPEIGSETDGGTQVGRGAVGLHVHPHDLSAGTRVALAISLQLSLCRPILMLDEPTRGLDAQARQALAGMLREVAASSLAVVFASHDEEFVAEVADQVLEMAPGVVRPHEPMIEVAR